MELISCFSKFYWALIEKAKLRDAPTGYCERHHIVPKSLGGSDTPENLVLLTAREHFIAHALLMRATTGVERRKMGSALSFMVTGAHKNRYTPRSSFLFEGLRTRWAESRRGFKHTEESKLKMNYMRTDAHRKALSESAKARFANVPKTPEHRQHISEGLRGRSFSIEHKSNLGAALKGKRLPQECYDRGAEKRRGQKKSADSVRKTADAHRGMKRSEETKNKLKLAWERRKARTSQEEFNQHAAKMRAGKGKS